MARTVIRAETTFSATSSMSSSSSALSSGRFSELVMKHFPDRGLVLSEKNPDRAIGFEPRPTGEGRQGGPIPVHVIGPYFFPRTAALLERGIDFHPGVVHDES